MLRQPTRRLLSPAADPAAAGGASTSEAEVGPLLGRAYLIGRGVLEAQDPAARRRRRQRARPW